MEAAFSKVLGDEKTISIFCKNKENVLLKGRIFVTK